ncbi:MAG: methyltransferase domain-containing protein [Myxococcales bacterium]|nr:methyltransferase domain-containing protein [Myxococcales bacterium]MCB9642288.1 methyltransferase domain-containing protein [Myxococcales bacterium]
MDFERVAALYDRDIWPLWSGPFAQLLLREIPPQLEQPILEVFCNSGELSLVLLERLVGKARLIAIDPVQDLLDFAREKTAHYIRQQRVFYHHSELFDRFRLPDDLFGLSCSNLGLFYADPPDTMIEEMFRTLQPGGTVILTLPLRGSFLDLFGPTRTFLEQIGEEEAIRQLDMHEMQYRLPEQAMYLLHKVGFERVNLRRQSFRLFFDDAKSMLEHAFIRRGFLDLLLPVLRRHEREPVILGLIQLFDMMRAGKPLELVVRAGCLLAQKPQVEEDTGFF